jgi:hypothetical protein
MSGNFTLHFLYKGIPREIYCTLKANAYSYRILCKIDSKEIILEKDEEGNLRVLQADPFSGNDGKPDMALVKILIEEMEKVLQ